MADADRSTSDEIRSLERLAATGDATALARLALWRARATASVMIPILWTASIYPSKFSRKRDGYLHIEGRTRAEAIKLLSRMTEQWPGRWISIRTGGQKGRATVVRSSRQECEQSVYAGQDGMWHLSWDEARCQTYGQSFSG